MSNNLSFLSFLFVNYYDRISTALCFLSSILLILPVLPPKYIGLQNLIQRNEQLYSSGDMPSGGVALPFILVQVDLDVRFLV